MNVLRIFTARFNADAATHSRTGKQHLPTYDLRQFRFVGRGGFSVFCFEFDLYNCLLTLGQMTGCSPIDTDSLHSFPLLPLFDPLRSPHPPPPFDLLRQAGQSGTWDSTGTAQTPAKCGERCMGKREEKKRGNLGSQAITRSSHWILDWAAGSSSSEYQAGIGIGTKEQQQQQQRIHAGETAKTEKEIGKENRQTTVSKDEISMGEENMTPVGGM
ncbi:hypothetical protein LX32DRAFT_634121 [Colletotrichum zoysiae]|uniref:Uncharacterized protein n=1 Tax=Colletotrichum zoysiae TaxID=1216348 RepID=A0AAD9M7A4_9PEZI|nr:hypothetical protein LX32DRAFT_634121 [Colletotrichum zoysiae]